ncbi:BTAD domain-containing putative transcriptional regulator [Lentzea sp. NPDC051208]|uniref:AfsR/SARP family transcriptional regulator n=1 Tax=Lentzea sp. NPDC051208 TaxID=3154642 RepID=UPI00341996B6
MAGVGMFRVIGAVDRVASDGSGLGVAAKPRALLAALLLNANEWVPVGRLIEAVWPGGPPRSAPGLVKTYVWTLRGLLDGDRIEAGPGGYRILVGRDELDASLFEVRVRDGREALRAGRVQDAAQALEGALELWRGEPYPGLGLADAEPARVRLAEQWLGAQEDLAEARIGLGLAEEVVPALRGLVAEHPFRERSRGLLMTALYQAGRQVDALDVYDEGRTLLDRDLGLVPGAELREVQARVLAQDLDARRDHRRPAQIPVAPAGFAGRADAVAALDRLPGRGGICVVAGLAGAGKTALVVHWAHSVRSQFPDGQLYLDLRGHGVPVTPLDALTRLSTALGVDRDSLCAEVDDAAATYRTVLSGRRVLVVLDDAFDADQVRPLLPGTPNCLVVVTSRARLDGLVAREGADQIVLDVLTPSDAHAVLVRVLGPARVGAEPDAAAELVELCARLPLALRIAAAALLARPDRSIADYNRLLRENDRLVALAVPGDATTAVRAAFALSYTALPSRARALFRLLGRMPGIDISAEAAAVLAGGAEGLDGLCTAHLVREHAPGRYTFHDLLRLYAAERSAAEDDPAHVATCVNRLLDWYTTAVRAAANAVDPARPRLPGDTAPIARAFADAEAATAWLDAEGPNLAAVADLLGPDGRAWLIADALRGYFLRTNGVHWQAVAGAGLRAAEVAGDAAALSAMHSSLGVLNWTRGGFAAADEHLRAALSHAREAGWTPGEITAATNLGLVRTSTGPLDEAADLLVEAMRAGARTGDTRLRGSILINLGGTRLGQARLADAVECFQGACEANAGALAMVCLAEVHLFRGDLAAADEQIDRALEWNLDCPNAHDHALALEVRARLTLLRGKPGQALDLLDRAAELADGHPLFAADVRNHRGTALRHLGRVDEALAEHRTSLAQARHHARAELDALVGIAEACLRNDEAETARRHAATAAGRSRQTGHRLHHAQALTTLAAAMLRLGDRATAQTHATAAHLILGQAGARPGQAEALIVLARCANDRDGELTGLRRARKLLTRAHVATDHVDEMIRDASARVDRHP